MTDYRATQYESENQAQWDALVSKSPQGALQHLRGFLSYHGQRFQDLSVLLWREKELVAVFPAAVASTDGETVVSHPGAAYGGLVSARGTRQSEIPNVANALLQYLGRKGFRNLVIRPTWHWLVETPDDTFLHELLLRGAESAPWQLVSVCQINERPNYSSRRKRMLRKAQRTMRPVWGTEYLEAFWVLLTERLRASHNVLPTHTLNEVSRILESFPESLRVVTAWENRNLVAGALLFVGPSYAHVQYMAASDNGRNRGATDLVVDASLDFAAASKLKWLSLGSSLDPKTRIINSGLLDFKSEFGASTLMVPKILLSLI